MKEIVVDYAFSELENQVLTNALLRVKESPYRNYPAFRVEVYKISESSAVPASFRELCFHKQAVNQFEDPYVFLKNCPVDPDLPLLDFDAPVVDKRNRKHTFVAEAFLELYAQLMHQEPIGYVNVNDGDIFQDIHPMRKLIDSQSQKAAKGIYFHKDLANHFVRPDWVNILGLRSSPENEIYTSFVRNKDLIEALPADILQVLRTPEFSTPYDDLTLYDSNKALGDTPLHPVLGGAEEYDIRFFESRTRGVTPRAIEAVEILVDTLHTLKQRLLILKGDFIGSANNECIHSKEVLNVRDPDAVQNRWLIKTVNVRFLDQHKVHMHPGEIRIVNG